MTAVLINIAAILAGGSLGLALRARLSQRIQQITFQALGLFTLLIGIRMAIEAEHLLRMVMALVAGGILGEWLDLEKQLQRLAARLRRFLPDQGGRFSEGFVTAFLLYCVGTMSTLGPLEAGLGREPTILMTKTVLDGISSVALASSLGAGVLLSVVPMFFLQGGIALFAGFLAPYLSDIAIREFSAVGGVLLLGLGLNILEISRLRIVNLLPALLISLLLESLPV